MLKTAAGYFRTSIRTHGTKAVTNQSIKNDGNTTTSSIGKSLLISDLVPCLLPVN